MSSSAGGWVPFLIFMLSALSCDLTAFIVILLDLICCLFCRINVTFVETDGTEKHVKVPVGTSMLEAAHSNDIELEGKCSTFHTAYGDEALAEQILKFLSALFNTIYISCH